MTDATKTCTACLTTIDVNATRCSNCTQRQPDAGLSRDVQGRVLGGVCAALAQHFSWDVTLLRIIFVSSVAVTGGLVFWVYVATWLMTPFGRFDRAPMARFLDAVGAVFSPSRSQPRPVSPE
jgi:phage shock protein C